MNPFTLILLLYSLGNRGCLSATARLSPTPSGVGSDCIPLPPGVNFCCGNEDKTGEWEDYCCRECVGAIPSAEFDDEPPTPPEKEAVSPPSTLTASPSPSSDTEPTTPTAAPTRAEYIPLATSSVPYPSADEYHTENSPDGLLVADGDPLPGCLSSDPGTPAPTTTEIATSGPKSNETSTTNPVHIPDTPATLNASDSVSAGDALRRLASEARFPWNLLFLALPMAVFAF